ncbi:extracellular calcium-sensing receptor [Nematostella vectensis]|uniref:extracellular calcium-sensing receptor n=1 Tax=Nematostella vectensis TaxID=45351 RepID=UPI00207726AD|nr:extracellular calcium-sensing receptor [Nematostella vectensis]
MSVPRVLSGILCFFIMSMFEAHGSQMSRRHVAGDLIIGGLFPIHETGAAGNSCGGVLPKGLLLTEAMVYAVHRVNHEKVLPFNMTLGLDIRDTCNLLSNALRATLNFVELRKHNQETNASQATNYYGVANSSKSNSGGIESGSLISVLGAGRSELSVVVNTILSLYDIPQLGYTSSSGVLSDKSRYKTFLRVVPPDTKQAKTLVKLVAHFGWNYISLVSSDDQYGGPLREVFKHESRLRSVCLAHDIVLPYQPTAEYINAEVTKLKKALKAKVIVIFSLEYVARMVIASAHAHNLTDRIWIASDSWSDAIERFQSRYPTILGNAIGIMFKFTLVPDFLKHLSLRMSGHDAWADGLRGALRAEGLYHVIMSNSTDAIRQDKHTRTALARVSYVIDGVYMIAYAIRDYCLSQNTDNKNDSRHVCLKRIEPKVLLKLLFGQTRKGFTGDITIDASGDPSGVYDLIASIHSQRGPSSCFAYNVVGSYDTQSDVLTLNHSLITWNNTPISRCSQACRAGFYILRKPSDPPCCWECRRCPFGRVSDTSNATNCEDCPSSHFPNSEKTRCVFVPLRYLNWRSPWSVVIVVWSILAFLLTNLTILMFIKHRTSPVVRACSFEISIVLLCTIALGFLIPFFEIGKVSDASCKTSAFTFAVVFAATLSLILAKINRTVLVFTRHSGEGWLHSRYLMSSKAHFVSALLLVLLQVAACIAWFYQYPPHAVITPVLTASSLQRLLYCAGNTNEWFMLTSGFLILLSLICTGLAFRSRNFPENYNHAKFITYAMFTFNLIWLTFMGAYFGAPQRGLHQQVIRSFAMILSNLCLLVIMFGPKLYIILFRPDLNNARTFRKMTLEHILKSSSLDHGGSSLSMASVRSQGNMFVMDLACDPNEKAVQTLRVLMRNAYTQTEAKSNNKLFAQLFALPGRTRRSGARGGRAWSESDTVDKNESDQRTPKVKPIKHSSSASQLSGKATKSMRGNRNLHDIMETDFSSKMLNEAEDDCIWQQTSAHNPSCTPAGNLPESYV